MSAQYRFFLREADGTALAWIPPTAWVQFSYTRRVNDVGRFEGIINLTNYEYLWEFFDVEPGGHLDAILEVWRSVDDTPPIYRLDQQFLMRYDREELLNDGRPRGTVIGRTIEYLLESCTVFPDNANPPAMPPEGDEATDYYGGVFPWPLPTAPNFDGIPLVLATSDTASKLAALVEWAQISNPIALVNVTIPAPPAGGIPAHHIGERFTSLLDALKAASGASWWASFHGLSATPINNGCDWKLTPAVAAPYIPWSFDVRVGQWGTDHRASSAAPVVFSPTKNNMNQPVTISDRLEERTKVYVGGDGADAARNILAVVNNARIADSIYNKREKYVDSRKIDPFAAVPPPYGIDQATEEGQRYLKELGIRRPFTFILTENKNTQYGKDFDLGDLVSAAFGATLEDFQVRQIEINVGAYSNESIDVELGPLDGSAAKSSDFFQQLVSLIREIQAEATGEAAGT